ncbi:hypothetical protein [Natronoglomus mannanivorans]|uniref:Uncharacterized protein n=1 Tax=Natronoglomus mannanivorans TaxID=2979990 RepID=A0AAP2YXJ4_9EURY|nr:hypothetical protein [Halobacteria archaeon AArc-xg1-1]
MSDTDSSPVRFRCADTDADEAVAPTTAAAALRNGAGVEPTIHSASRSDPRVFDCCQHGWCLYPPTTITLEPGEGVSPEAATDYVMVHDDRSTAETLCATVETLWHVEVDEGYPLFVTSWSGSFDHRIGSQLVTAADGVRELSIPITTDDAVTYDPETPIAQVIPIPEALLEESFECGALDEQRIAAIREIDDAMRFYDPYGREYRVEKQPSELVGADRLE